MSRIESSQPQDQAEDSNSIERLVYEHYAYVHRLAYSILDDPHEADDAAQEAFIAASRAWSGFRGQSSVRTWLTAITVNACRGRLRKHKTRQGLQVALQALHLMQPHSDNLEDAAIQADGRRALQQALAALDEKHRLPVLLYYVHQQSVPEIAAALNTSPGTIYSRLYYARRKLLARLDHPTLHAEAPDESHSNPVA